MVGPAIPASESSFTSAKTHAPGPGSVLPLQTDGASSESRTGISHVRQRAISQLASSDASSPRSPCDFSNQAPMPVSHPSNGRWMIHDSQQSGISNVVSKWKFAICGFFLVDSSEARGKNRAGLSERVHLHSHSSSESLGSTCQVAIRTYRTPIIKDSIAISAVPLSCEIMCKSTGFQTPKHWRR